MKQLAIAVCLLWGAVAFSQDHAPVAAQCQADRKLWRAESVAATDGSGFSPSMASLSVDDLLNRAKEMLECVVIDSQNDYNPTAALLLTLANKRLIRYLQETDQVERYTEWEKQQQKMRR
jgi:hypothetical protein